MQFSAFNRMIMEKKTTQRRLPFCEGCGVKGKNKERKKKEGKRHHQFDTVQLVSQGMQRDKC